MTEIDIEQDSIFIYYITRLAQITPKIMCYLKNKYN